MCQFSLIMSSPTLFSNYVGKLDEIVYKLQSKTPKGGTVVYFSPNKNTTSNMLMQLQTPEEPKCKTPFGASVFEDDGTATRKNLELSLEYEPLVQFFKEFDEHNIQVALKHPEWFKKTLDEAQIRNMYYPLLTFDTSDNGYPPRLHTKVNTHGQNIVNVLLYTDENGFPEYRPGSVADIQKYDECMIICEASSLWFQSKQFGMSLVTTDIIIFQRTQRKEFGFIWDSGPVPTKITSPTNDQPAFSPTTSSGVLTMPPINSSSVLMMPLPSAFLEASTPGVTLIGKDDNVQPASKKSKIK
jgi:hypothetical protein